VATEDKHEHAIDEYRDLRAELLQSQQTRIQVLAFTFAGTTALSGVVLNAEGGECALTTGLMVFALLLLAAAIQLTTVLTQRIDLLADFISARLENQLEFKWESDWRAYRERMGARGSGRLPLGTSKALANFYFVLAFVDTGVYFVSADEGCLAGAPLVVIPAGLAVYLALDLRLRWSRGWTGLYEDPPQENSDF
jgi:hypothetical protein